jgi:hypothetical protein
MIEQVKSSRENLKQQLQQMLTKREQLRIALREANVHVERVRGALMLAEELLSAQPAAAPEVEEPPATNGAAPP